MLQALFHQGLNARVSTAIKHVIIVIRDQLGLDQRVCVSVSRSKPRTFLGIGVNGVFRYQCHITETSRQMATKSSPPITVAAPIEDCVSSKLFSFCDFVKFDMLTAEEKLIHTKHLKALQNQQELYEDPSTGYSVLTRLAHLKRGQCCGNACRHCPYGQKSVPADIPKKKYNSAFFV